MVSLKNMFLVALLLSVAYAALRGGRTGQAGGFIFMMATIGTFFASGINPLWDEPLFGVFLVDLACMLALAVLAFWSSRCWPIWALGFQIVAVLTHLVRMWDLRILPDIYQAMATFWSVPILLVMVAGTKLDSQARAKAV